MLFFGGLAQSLLAALDRYELPALFVLIAIEEAGVPIPIPGDTLILLAGAHAGRFDARGILTIAVACAGAVAGASVLFALMRHGGRPFLDRFGKYLLLDRARLERLDSLFQRFGVPSIAVGRLIPGLRIFTTVLAGLSAMSYRTFLLAMAPATILWATFYYLLGVWFGAPLAALLALLARLADTWVLWPAQQLGLESHWEVALLYGLLLALVVAALWLWRRHAHPASPPVAAQPAQLHAPRPTKSIE